ncbi:MAG: porin [Flavobacteriaceae bacterium]|nr:porin [Flavobacteriaceae bacterium]|tara:strand:+ start:19955 stop:21112 length:1158 start_codon:yes stop_codon:yes gene_type:complete
MITRTQEISAPKFGKGLMNISGKDSTWSMNFSARVQYLTSTTWHEENDYYGGPNSNSLIRRSRLKFKGFAYNPNLTYKIELALSNRDISGGSNFTSDAPRIILDASVRWRFNKNWWIQFGQAKLPGNIERVISSAKLSLVDRSMLNSKFNIDRDFGIQLRHKFNISNNFLVKNTFAISQGEGRNVSKGNIGGHQYTMRVDMLPLGNFKKDGDYEGDDLLRVESPKLLIGFAYDYNNDAVKTRSNMGSYMITDYGFFETDITTFFINSHFKYKGLSIMGEYADRNSNDAIAKNSDGSLTGDIVNVGSAISLQPGYVFPSNIAITGRYTNITFDDIVTDNNNINQYTLGLSKYFVNHKLKMQTDMTYENSLFSDNKIFWRLQFEIHF